MMLCHTGQSLLCIVGLLAIVQAFAFHFKLVLSLFFEPKYRLIWLCFFFPTMPLLGRSFLPWRQFCHYFRNDVMMVGHYQLASYQLLLKLLWLLFSCYGQFHEPCAICVTGKPRLPYSLPLLPTQSLQCVLGLLTREVSRHPNQMSKHLIWMLLLMCRSNDSTLS